MSSRQNLQRTLGHGQMTMIVLGSALGTGLFLGSAPAIALAGPAVLVAFAIGSLLAAIIGGTTGEMAVRYPVRGGFGTLATRYLGPYAGFLTRWAYWTCTVIITGVELVAVSYYLHYWWPGFGMTNGILIFGFVIIMLNLKSVKYFGMVEFFLSSIKVLALTLFILVGLCLVFFGLPDYPASGTSALVKHGFMPHGWHGVWLAMSIVMFSFGGIEMLSISAAEAKNPARSVRTSAKVMMWRLAAFYVLSLFVVLCLIPWRDAITLGSGVERSPFVLVFSELGVPAVAHIVNLLILIAALSAANANLYAGSRLMHSLAADRMAPGGLATISSEGIPTRSLWVSAAGVLLAIVMSLAAPEDALGAMMDLVMVCALTVWTLILLAYISYRRTEGATSGFLLPGGIWTAGVGVLLLVGVWASLFARVERSLPAIIGLVYFALLSLVYFAVVKERSRPEADGAFEEAKRSVRGVSGGEG